MSAAPVAERVRDAIRARLLARYWRPGERLDPASLAEDLVSSVTPVRDALHVLVGEGLVTAATGEGFHVPGIDEPALQDLYRWNMEILAVSIHAWSRDNEASLQRSSEALSQDGVSIAALCNVIAGASRNAEHASAIARNNARLSAVRTVEGEVMPNAERDVVQMLGNLRAERSAELRKQLSTYHKARERRAAAIVRAYYRFGGGSTMH